MSANPEPYYFVFSVHAQCAVVKANADGVKAAYALEMKGGMPRILLKKRELTIRKLADGQG
jgi:hypothetical protein